MNWEEFSHPFEQRKCFDLRAVLLGLGAVGLSLLTLLERTDSPCVPGLNIDIAGVADSSGYLVGKQVIGVHDLVKAKRESSLSFLPGFIEGGRARELIETAEADVVVDCLPTDYSDCSESRECMFTSLKAGRHYVTASKAVMALHMKEALEKAEGNGVLLKFGATVGGGTPFIDFGSRCICPGTVTSLRGVLNGTSNYILTRMAEGLTMQEALSEARQRGIAEADPSNDLSGRDSAAKIVILANWLCGTSLTLHQVRTRGIETLSSGEISEAGRRGKVIKLIASYRSVATVSPEEIDINDRINVSGSLNALSYFTGSGDSFTLSGEGAGGESTARAVLRDLAAVHLEAGPRRTH